MKLKTIVALGAMLTVSMGAHAQFGNLLKQAKNKVKQEVKNEKNKAVDKVEDKVDKEVQKGKKQLEKEALNLVGQGFLSDDNYKHAALHDDWTPESSIDVLCEHYAYVVWYLKESMAKATKKDKVDLEKIDWENEARMSTRKGPYKFSVADAILNHKDKYKVPSWYEKVDKDCSEFYKSLNTYISSQGSEKDGVYKSMNAHLKLLKKAKCQGAADYLWANGVALRNLAVEYHPDEIDENSKEWKNFNKDMDKQKSKVSAEVLEKYPLTEMAELKVKIQKEKEEAEQRAAARKQAEIEANTQPLPKAGMNDASLAAKCLAYAKNQYPDWKPVKAIIRSNGWTVKRNVLGTPIERHLLVWIVCDDQGGDRYMVRDISVKQEYSGGRYSSNVSYHGVGLNSFYVKKSDVSTGSSSSSKSSSKKSSKKKK